MATQSCRGKVCAARDEASLASAILQIMASRKVARGTPSRVRSCLQRPCGALSDHMAPDTSCCDAAATRARIDTEDSALSLFMSPRSGFPGQGPPEGQVLMSHVPMLLLLVLDVI